MHTFCDSNSIHARSLCKRVTEYDSDASIINVWGCAEVFPVNLGKESKNLFQVIILFAVD